jgi:hypothetical protein
MPDYPPQDRLVRKEVALGTLREMEPSLTHIGVRSIAPMLEVPTDDVIFDYARPLTDGLVSARAEDAESELAQKDLAFGGTMRANVIDWAVKDHYSASDVTRYREAAMIAAQMGGVDNVPMTFRSHVEDFRQKVARDDALRRRKIDNRLEWLIMGALDLGQIAYTGGNLAFTVNYGRPGQGSNGNHATAGDQHDASTSGGNGYWSATTSDPVDDILDVQDKMYDAYGVRMTRAITSRKVLRSVWNSDKFAARSGLALSNVNPSGTTGGTPVDPRYLIDGWSPDAAIAVLERITGCQFTVYDSVYRTRPVGSTTITNTRFTTENVIMFLPDPADVAELDDAIGFGRTLTSPHPEGNWTPGFYEWEKETTDPWGMDRGTGIKAFPVFPHMELTYRLQVLA